MIKHNNRQYHKRKLWKQAIVPGLCKIPRKCFQLRAGQTIKHVASGWHILSRKGKIIRKVRGHGKVRLNQAASPIVGNGWLSVGLMNIAPCTFVMIKSVWNVPDIPQTDGNSYFLFNGVGDESGNSILQAVLAFGSNGQGGADGQWQISSWYHGPSASTFSHTVKVNPGDVIVGVIARSLGQNGPTWSCYFEGFEKQTMLPVLGAPDFSIAYHTCEAYQGYQIPADPPLPLNPPIIFKVESVLCSDNNALTGATWQSEGTFGANILNPSPIGQIGIRVM